MKRIARRTFIAAAAAIIAAPFAHAQGKAAQPAVIGILEYGGVEGFEQSIAAFKEGLREGGFVEGRNLRIERRFSGDDFRKLDRVAADLVRANVQVIYAPGSWSVFAAKEATKTIPIVFSGVNDPVRVKFVESLARPGGNVTGISLASTALTQKRVELMHEMFPLARRLGVIYDEDVARACQIELKEIGQAGKHLRVDMREYPYTERSELQHAFDSAQRSKVAAILIPTTIESRRFEKELAAYSVASRIPTVHNSVESVEAGGLMSFGPQQGWGQRRAGLYVSRILKGEKAANLPVEQPHAYELVINLKTARAMGVTIPQSILVRADRVIE
jgi:putative tryptophan/tyrosine transport system substrate-binding protein